MQFQLLNGAIEVTDATGRLVWRGKPLQHRVKSVIPLAGEDICIVLLDPDVQLRSHFENVVCVDPHGGVVWRASLPTSGNDDCYLALAYEGGALVANSWSGFRVRIDPRGGRILDAVFTK
ncbi:MAG TPA: hypothetical protein VLM85_21290 [Polyangiaceae bacterium]|nr:hypothetical protein [Polyangiaceae bacterium]